LFQNVVERLNCSHCDLEGPEGEMLRELAGRAMTALGGEAEPCAVSLKNYDHRVHGPFLGISDEGSAVNVIRRAALSSPKMAVLGFAPPIVAGVALDAERLAAVGEVAVGLDEYRDIRLGCLGSLLTSTNVGTRLNLKYYKLRPIVRISGESPLEKAVVEAVTQVKKYLLPFVETPDRKPRPVTILLDFEPGTRFVYRRALLRRIARAFQEIENVVPGMHRLGLLAETGRKGKGVRTAMRSIRLAAAVSIPVVVISGIALTEAVDKISMPGLLEYFSPEVTRNMLEYAAKLGIEVEPKNMIDPDTVSRNVWAALQTARNMGLELGKYGLFPLTILQADQVMAGVQGYFANWTAAPAFYVDYPTIGRKNVYTTPTILDGIKEWLGSVGSHAIPVVLIDTADKDKGRRLLKDACDDQVGILDWKDIKNLDIFASKQNIRILWAGGITLRQVFELGKLEVFGVYVTSATACLVPATGDYVHDPLIAAVKEPTREGVTSALLLLQAGFLVTKLSAYGESELARQLENAAKDFLARLSPEDRGRLFDEKAAGLTQLTMEGWKIHYGSTGELEKR